MAKRLISLELKKMNEEDFSIKGKMEEELDKGEESLFFSGKGVEEYKEGIGNLLKEDKEEKTDYSKKILFRRDTFSKWQIIDPVLREKEIIVCHFSNGSKCFKIGDGISKFSQLPEIKSVSDLPDEFFIYYLTHDIPCIKICLKDDGDN